MGTDLLMTESEKMLESVVREFVDAEVKPRARIRDEEEDCPKEIWHGMARLGLQGLGVDSIYGGSEGTTRHMVIAVEGVSRGDAAAAVSLLAHRSLGVETILQFGSEEQRAKYLPPAVSGKTILGWALSEPGSGSDAGSLDTTASLQNGVYYLNGTKTFITNGSIADSVVVFATTDKKLGQKGITGFIVDQGSVGFRARKQLGKLGIRGSDTAELTFRGTPIPMENRLGEEGKGFKYAMEILNSSRIMVAAQSVGIGQAALDTAIRYCQQRHSFGIPISRHQAIQFMLADMATDMYASRIMTFNAANLKDQGLPYSQQASMAKLYASEACFRVASNALQIHGGYGYFKDSDVERYFRDSRVTSIYEGTSEIQRMVIARSLLRTIEPNEEQM